MSRGLVRAIAALSVLIQLSLADELVLLDATPIRMRLSRHLSSNTEQIGNKVDFEVLDEVRVRDLVVVPKGAVAIGSVTEAISSRRMGRAGKLNVSIEHVRTVVNDQVALRAVRESEGGSNAGKMTGAIVATSIVFFPAAPLFLLMKGKEYKIPQGTEITAYVNGNTKLVEAKYTASASPQNAAPTTAAKQSTFKSLTNEDILSLKASGFSEDLIIAKIKSSPAQYSTAIEDLQKLKAGQLSDAVIKAMIEASGKQ